MPGQVIQGFFPAGRPRPLPGPRTAQPVQAKQGRLAARPISPGPPGLAFTGGSVAQRFGGDGNFAVDPVQLGLARGGGTPLPAPLLAKMEAAFGADFSAVRVHVGAQAARIGAIAFTTGNDLYFAPGRYQPDSAQGQQLIGHELAHVIQQRQGRVRASGGGVLVVQDHALEAEADRLGVRAAAQRVAVQPKKAATSALPPASRVMQAAREPKSLLGEGKLSPRARQERVFAVMWNGVGDLSRRLDQRAREGALPTFAQVREYEGYLNWAREDGVPSVTARLARHEAAIRATEESAFEHSRRERTRGLERAREHRMASRAIGPGGPRARLPRPPITVRVGVVFRIDSQGTAHSGHDMEGIRAINRIGQLGLPLRFQVAPVALPFGATGKDIPERLSDTAQNLAAFRNQLRGIDILYIPGAPAAITAQIGSSGDDGGALVAVPLKNPAKKEAESRGPYELGLIMAARTMGIPVLAICAGSWRLLQAYGGQVRTLPPDQRALHKSVDTSALATWGLKHGIAVQRGSLLHDLLGQIDLPDSNSTHWAVASEEQGVLLHNSGGARYPLKHHGRVRRDAPGRMLRVTARAYGPSHEATVEAFETRHGAPHLGIQWHPETYLPGMPGEGAASGRHRLASARLFRGMMEAGRTRHQHEILWMLPDLQRVLGLHSLASAAEVYEEIAQSYGHPPTRSDVNSYLSMFNLRF